MRTYLCEEMMCGHCVSRIEGGLGEEGIGHKVDLDKKTVTIEKDEEISKALEVLDDLGFSAKEV